jgi:hypothetical protein
VLETFAREAEAGLGRIILLVLDNAGWHVNLKIPDGIRLIYLPPYTPELQPAETLWSLVDEPIVNQPTSRPSRNSKQKSPNGASHAPSNPNKSRVEPGFIGGQSGSLRTNQPEMVLGVHLRCRQAMRSFLIYQEHSRRIRA